MGYDGATLYLVEGRYYERGCIKYLYTGDEEMRESANVCLIYTTKEVLFLKKLFFGDSQKGTKSTNT